MPGFRRCRPGALAQGCVSLAAALVTAAAAAAPSFVPGSAGLPPSNVGYDCSPFNPGGWVGVALGDIDGDGDDDLAAIGRLLSGVHAWRSDGAGSWSEVSAGLDGDCHGRSDIELRDVDHDRLLDLGTVGGINGGPAVFLGDGAGGWAASSGGLTASNGEGFAFGDFDGDGNVDLATIGHFSGGAHAWLGDGAGSWTERSAGLPTLEGGHRGVAGDFDGDGKDELVVTRFLTFDPLIDGVSIWSYDAAAGWSMRWSAYFDQPYGVAIDDANRDGLPDLFVSAAQDQTGTPGTVHVFLNQDDGRSFSEASTGLGVLAYWGDMATGDLDGDGDTDIVAGDWSGIVRIFLNDGSSSWTLAANTGLPLGADKTEGVAVGDVDQDCRADVALALYQAGVRVYRNTTPVPCAIRADAGPPQQSCGAVELDASRSRACGCAAADVRFRWWQGTMLLRDWATAPGVTVTPTATTSYRVDVACVQDLTCFVSDDTAVVFGGGGPAPAALGNVLGLVKVAPPGLALAWTDLAGGAGEYQALGLAAALGAPTQAAFDGGVAGVVASAPPGAERATVGDGMVNPPGLVFFRVRATAACGGTAGPA